MRAAVSADSWGESNQGWIAQSYATGNVDAQSVGQAGGLVGTSYYGKITDSWATGDVAGTSYVASLSGANSAAPILCSAATGNVSGTGVCVGGLGGTVYLA